MNHYKVLLSTLLLSLLVPDYLTGQQFIEISEELGITDYFDDFNSIGGGTAFFDYDADGDDDLYVTGGRNADALYRNNGDGTFTDVTEESGLDLTAIYFTTGVTTGDIDNDGYREIFVTTFGFVTNLAPNKRNLLFKNMGDGTFQEITPQANVSLASRSVSATFLDHDQDGFLDIYVVNYVDRTRFEFGSNGEVVGFDHDCYENQLYHNNGNSTFTEASHQLGLADIGCGLAVTNTDYDMDGDADIYAINDFGHFVSPNQMYVNNLETGVFDILPLNNDINIGLYGMGIAMADYDLDQDYDYYVSNLGSNALLNNNGTGDFENVSMEAGVDNTSTVNDLLVTSWGNAFVDIDNNIYEDLLVANGHIPAAEFIATDQEDPNKIYYNNGDNTFTDISDLAGFNNPNKARGLVYSDYDMDGDVDIFVHVMRSDSFPEAHTLFYRNDLVSDNNWVQFRLEGTTANRDAIGAQVKVFVDDLVLLREIWGGGSHASQSSSVAHFGLAENDAIDSVQVVWPGGDLETFHGLSINERHHLIQNTQAQVRIDFIVDMTFQETTAAGIFLKITDSDGNAQRKLMYSPFQNGFYSTSFVEAPGFNGTYTILNGDCLDESCAEDLSEQDCTGVTIEFDRILEPILEDTTINLCFGICAGIPCQSTVDSFAVNFLVNTAPLDEDLQDIYLVGISPDGSRLPMSDDDGDGRYEISVNLEENFSGYYAYANGDCADLSCVEDLSGQGCTDPIFDNFRFLPPLTQDTSVNACFAVCNTDSCFVPVDTFTIQINLNMTNEDQNPTGVFIVGDIFGATPGITPLFDGNDDGIFTNFFEVPENTSFYYTFVNGITCPGTECYEDLSGQACADPEQNNFRFFGPLTEDTILDICFGECQLAACLPSTDSVDVTFQLNMATVDTSPDGVYWLNDFDPPGEFQLTDVDGDDIYTMTIRRPEGFSTYYSFTNGLCSDLSCREDLEGQDCGDLFELNYRLLDPVFSDTVLNLCYGECDLANCIAPIDSVDIQINVNMVAVDVAVDGVFLVEDFFGAPGAYPLEDPDGDGVYSTILRQPEGFSSFYRFANGNCPDLTCLEDLTGQNCGPTNPDDNRWISPVLQDTVINTCFGECTPDLDCTLPPDPVEVVFTVNLANDPPNPGGVYLTGNFGLTENDFAMTNNGIDSVWTTTVPITPGQYYYRFINGTPAAGTPETLVEDVTDECSELVDGVRLRPVEVIADQPVVLDTVCFNLCSQCDLINSLDGTLAELLTLELQPNPARDFSRLICRNAPWADKQIQLINAMGQVVATFQLSAGEQELRLNTASLSPGMYWVTVEVEGRRLVKKLIVQ